MGIRQHDLIQMWGLGTPEGLGTDLREVRVLQCLCYCDPVGGIELQHAVQQVQCRGAGLGQLGFPVGRLHLSVVGGWCPMPYSPMPS